MRRELMTVAWLTVSLVACASGSGGAAQTGPGMANGSAEAVHSKDGTLIAYRKSGSGPPLVLIHGTTGDHKRWAPIVPLLEEHFTVYAIDRRGRGASGDGPAYALEREIEDIVAIVDGIDRPASLLGHSYGGLCAIEAALLTDNVDKLVLYELSINIGGGSAELDKIERLEALLAEGDRTALLTTFMRELVGISDEDIAMLQSRPNWPARLAAAHTVPRELRVEASYRFEPRRFTAMRTPTLLLVGGESPPSVAQSMEVVHQALPVSQVVVMPGQAHVAMDTAPALFVREVVSFLAPQ